MDKQLEMFPAIKPKAKLMAKNTFTKALQMLDNPMMYMQQFNEVANPATLKRSIHQGLITHDYHTLSHIYIGSGLIATAIENPINDAFSKGFEIKSEHLGSDDIKQIMNLIDEKELVEKIKEAMTWQSLFGGGGLIVAREYNDATQRIFELEKGEDFDLFPVNRWQLNFNPMGINPAAGIDVDNADFFWFANEMINAKNVILLKGKKAPFIISQTLNGWGLSDVEKMINDLNIYTKTRDVLFEILDESKIDVYKIDGFLEAIMGNREAAILRRIEFQNRMKSHKNALVMDIKDNYDNKSNTFSGLSEVSHENRIDIAAALRQPVVKLFGTSPSGFTSGEEEFGQYYQMVDSGARKIAARVLKKVVALCANSLLGFCPSFTIEFPPFKAKNEKEEEDIVTTKIANAAQLFQLGAITSVSEYLKKRNVEL